MQYLDDILHQLVKRKAQRPEGAVLTGITSNNIQLILVKSQATYQILMLR